VGVTAAEIALAVGGIFAGGPGDPTTFERTLADLVQTAHLDWSGLRGALAQTQEQYALDVRSRLEQPAATPLRQLHAVVETLVWLPAPTRHRGAVTDLGQLATRLSYRTDRAAGMDPYALRTPADLLTLRLAEAAARIGGPSPVDLVSTPTTPEGWLDPGTLLARITQAEREGWQPWPLDFDQALLRLPAQYDAATLRGAQRLASPAGRRLAGWLRGGRPTLPRVDGHLVGPAPGRRPRPLAASAYPVGGPATPGTLIHLLRRGWFAPQCLADDSCWAECWPSLLPGHGDLVAAAYAWHREHPGTQGQGLDSSGLIAVARTAVAAATAGPEISGPGMAAALARGMTARSAARRAETAEALALLSASRRVGGPELGVALTRFGTRFDRQILRAAVPVLRRALDQRTKAERAAAAAVVGVAIVTWLPVLLPPAIVQPLPYTSHLIDAATEAFAATAESGVRNPTIAPETVNTLVALTRRPGASAVSAAARRLLTAVR
jgi:hypothetical protein